MPNCLLRKSDYHFWRSTFKRIYNATLLFHKSIALQLYMQNDIPDYLLRAIFAQASIFLQQVESPYKQYIEIVLVHTLFEKSWSWARAASQEVLSFTTSPLSLEYKLFRFCNFTISRAARSSGSSFTHLQPIN
jgi:hypothetical protein